MNTHIKVNRKKERFYRGVTEYGVSSGIYYRGRLLEAQPQARDNS